MTTCPTCALVNAAEAAAILGDAPGVMRIHLASPGPTGPPCERHSR